MEIRLRKPSDDVDILNLVEGLGEWFDDHARTKAIPVDLMHQTTFVAEDQTGITGFIMLYVSEGRLNIGWMGVRNNKHRQGIGTLLLLATEEYARKIQIDEIATYTLGDSVDYEPYEATRRFYLRNGLKVYQRNQTDNPGCPEELRLKKMVNRSVS